MGGLDSVPACVVSQDQFIAELINTVTDDISHYAVTPLSMWYVSHSALDQRPSITQSTCALFLPHDAYSMHIMQGRNNWGGCGGPDPPKFGWTTPTFLMKSVITVT